jgi:hypothetical protein
VFTCIERNEKGEIQNIEKNEVTSPPSFSNTERHTLLLIAGPRCSATDGLN